MSSSVIQQYTQTPNNILALLSRYRVVIPGIQRHYVQGANNRKAESIRLQFVKEIIETICGQKSLNLHFIYGPINTDGEDSFVPVDGQQRLTTLWLLARYAAERCDSETRVKILELLSRFSYEDRINASRFCHALTLSDSHWHINEDPIIDILKQRWFLDYWIEDETVSSMIRMLSTIHNEWKNYGNELNGERVLDGLGSQISFELQIDSFGDDIYMKMNARGLQLTQWENFKSKFAKALGNYEKVWERDIEELSNKFFIISGENYELPDNSFFALFARIMVYEDNHQSMKSIKQLSDFTHDTWHQIELPFVPYSDFLDITNRHDTLATKVAESIVRLIKIAMDNYSKKIPYFGNRNLYETLFHPKNNNDLDFSLCCYEYFCKYDNVEDEYFIQATRLMWNILENVTRQDKSIYNRIAIVKRFISLNDPSLYSADAINVFNKEDAGQVFEEAEKSLKINDSIQVKPDDWDEAILGEWVNWKTAIEYAEEHAFFHGSIRFLYRDENGTTTWEKFATKLIHCKELFDAEGLKKDKKPTANKVLISNCDNWIKIKRTRVFGTEKESWKRILLANHLSLCVNNLLINPCQISYNDDSIINILVNDSLWTELIEDTEEYELEWKADSPSLWLNRYLYYTLKLWRNNREDILDEFSNNPRIIFESPEYNRLLSINDVNYYYAVPVFFRFKYKNKEYRFAWQTWGWIDMYDDNTKLYDIYYSKYGKGFNIKIVKESNDDTGLDTDVNYYINKLEECIDNYEKFILEIETSSL